MMLSPFVVSIFLFLYFLYTVINSRVFVEFFMVVIEESPLFS